MSGDIYLSFGIFISFSFVFECNFLKYNSFETFCEWNTFEWNSFGDLDIRGILSAILLPIKSPIASVVFWTALFETVFIASVVDFLVYQEVFDYT